MSKRLLTTIAMLMVLGLLAGAALGCGTDARDTATTGAPMTTTTVTSTAASTVSVPDASGAETRATSPTIALDSTLEPIVPPTLPEEIPDYIEKDPATGLHMTGTPLEVDLDSYRLLVNGKVANELSLTFDEIRSLPKVTATPTLVCEGYFEDTATWSGAPLQPILEMAGVQPDAEEIRLLSADGYSCYLPLDRALSDENFLAYELEGEPVSALHGFPVRAVFPEEIGGYWVKWLVQIEVQ